MDYEAGIHWVRGDLRASANLFAMEFREEIAPVGALSLTGSPLRVNVGASHRAASRPSCQWQATARLALVATVAITDARISPLHRRVEAHGVPQRAVTPDPVAVATQSATWRAGRGVTLLADARAVSGSALTSTGNREAVLPAYLLADAAVSWARGASQVTVRVINMLDRLAYGSGYASGGVNYVFPFATRHLMIDVRRAF